MKVSNEKIADCQVKLQIELEPGEVEKSLQETYSSLIRKVSVPGFRKGKAPRAILENYLGSGAVLSEALKELIPQAYERAIEEQGIEAIAQPEIEVISREPVVFSAVVPLPPEVELGDYQQIRVNVMPSEVSADEVDKALEELRERQAVWSPVERAVDFGDMLIADIWGEVDGKPFCNYQGVEYRVIKEHRVPLPGFAEKLIGMQKGEEREFVISFPLDDSDVALAGKEYLFKIGLKEIKEPKLPALDDDFARNFESDSLSSLREKVTDSLKAQSEEIARSQREAEVLKALEESYEHLVSLRDATIADGILPPTPEWGRVNPNLV